MDPGGTSSTGGAMDEIATFHAASLWQRFRDSLPLNGRAKRALGYQAQRYSEGRGTS
jgi:hypothetical protein